MDNKNLGSRHAILTLGNTDNLFVARSLENIVDPRSVYLLNGINDVAIFNQVELYETLRRLSQVPGIISSRTMILNNSYKEGSTRTAKNNAFLFLDSIYGEKERVLRDLVKIEDIYSLYGAVGLHDFVALTSFDNEVELREKINSIQGVRTAVLNLVERHNEPIQIIRNPQKISSPNYDSRNKRETDYQRDRNANFDYGRGAEEMARVLLQIEKKEGSITTVYAPLRGSKPIIDALMQAYRFFQRGKRDVFTPEIQFPVTSSFVHYPLCHPYLSKKGKIPASGRSTNRLELKRLLEKHSEELSRMLYVEEIVSGAILQGHLRDMIFPFGDGEREGIIKKQVEEGKIKLYVFGLAHRYGDMVHPQKEKFRRNLESKGLLKFYNFPIEDLVTEDRKQVLGQHYLLNELGPHTIPFIDDSREYPKEYHQFWGDVREAIRTSL